MGRAPCCEKNGLKKGPWTAEEDQKLVDYIQRHGHGSWRALPKNAGLLRCGKSCRLRWTNYLRPDIKRGKFSFEEEQTIIQLHGVLGNKWSAIAAQIPGRTDNEIKNYWNTHLKKRLLQMGIDPVTHRPRIDLFDLSNMRQLLAAAPNASLISQMAQWENARLEGLRREYILRLAAMMAHHEQNVGIYGVNDALMRSLLSRSQINNIGTDNANSFCGDHVTNPVISDWAQLQPNHQNMALDHYYNMLAQETLQIQAQMSRGSAQNTDQSCSSLALGNGSSAISSPSFQMAHHISSPTSTLDEFQLNNSNTKVEPACMNLQNENILQKQTHALNNERIFHELLQHDHESQADQDTKTSSSNLVTATSMDGFIANMIKNSKPDLLADIDHNSGSSSHHADHPQPSQWPDQDHHQLLNDTNSKIISSDAADQSMPALISSASSPNIFSEADHSNNLMAETSSTMLSMDNNYGIYAFPPDLLLDISPEITSSSCRDHHRHQNETAIGSAATTDSCKPSSTASGASSWSDIKSEDAKDYWANMLKYTIDANPRQ